MNKLEKIELRSSNLSKLNEIVEKAKEEKRELTENEVVEFRNLEKSIKDLDNELEINTKNTKKMDNNFSLFRSIDAVIKKEASNDTFEMPLTRALSPAGGESAIATDVAAVMSQLGETSLINKIGGKYLTGLQGDLMIPSITNMSFGWGTDGVESADANAKIVSKKLTPKLINGFVPVDNRLTIQSPSVEAAIMDSIYKVVDVKLSEALFSASSLTEKPAGLFAVASAATFTVAASGLTYQHILQLEEKILVNAVDATNVVIVMHPSVAARLKATAKSKDGIYEPVLKNGMIDNYKVIVSNQVANGYIAFVDATNLYSGVWSVKVTVDPYTLSTKNQLRLVVNALVDANIGNDKCVAWGKLS